MCFLPFVTTAFFETLNKIAGIHWAGAHKFLRKVGGSWVKSWKQLRQVGHDSYHVNPKSLKSTGADLQVIELFPNISHTFNT